MVGRKSYYDIRTALLNQKLSHQGGPRYTLPWMCAHKLRLLERSTTRITERYHTPRRTYGSIYNHAPCASHNYNIMSSIIPKTKVSIHKPLGIFSRVPRRYIFARPRRSKPRHGDLSILRSVSTVQVTPADCTTTGFPEHPMKKKTKKT